MKKVNHISYEQKINRIFTILSRDLVKLKLYSENTLLYDVPNYNISYHFNSNNNLHKSINEAIEYLCYSFKDFTLEEQKFIIKYKKRIRPFFLVQLINNFSEEYKEKMKSYILLYKL